MPGHIDNYVSKQEKELAKDIDRIYRQAAREVRQKLKDFTEHHKAKNALLKKRVKEGTLSEWAYKNWLKGQVFQTEQWKRKLDDIVKVYRNADEKAREIVGGTSKNIFCEAANYTAFSIEKDLQGAVSFNLYDKKTVERLIKDNPKMLPEWKINETKDYVWNEKRVQNAVAQGIIQGESIAQIGNRLTGELATSNAKKMNLFARTAFTGAQNAGRIERLHDAEDIGIEVRKKWLASLDNRTRDAHADLDGEEVPVDEPFHSILGPIMYPGDPTADPANVYNCRCTLTYVYPKYQHLQQNHQRYDREARKDIDYVTYKEWQRAKQPEPERAEEETVYQTGHIVVQGQDISETWERRADQFDFEINDVMDAQGFDGKPRIVPTDEFDELVKQANGGNGFIAQRTYSAQDQETLDAYRDQLYNGSWYVDCSTGGAQYGQGMYCAADYNGELTQGIRDEMEHYARLGQSRNITQARETAYNNVWNKAINKANDVEQAFIRSEYFHDATREQMRMLRRISDEELDVLYDKYNAIAKMADAARESAQGVSYTETLTLDPSAKIISYREIQDIKTGNLGIEYRQNIINRILDEKDFSENEKIFARYNLGIDTSWQTVNNAAIALGEEGRNKIMEYVQDIGEEATRAYNEEHQRRIKMAHIYQEKYKDIGSLATALGYDAINAEGHGQSGSYTVILNRTKVIFKESRR